MFENEKNMIKAVSYFILLTSIVVLLFISSKVLPLELIALVSLLFLYLYIQPTFYMKYYKFHVKKPDIKMFIPVFSEIGMFPRFYRKAYNISLALFLVSLLNMFLVDINFISNLFGDVTAFRYPTISLAICALTLIVFLVIRGLAYINIFNRIEWYLFNLDSTTKNIGLMSKVFTVFKYVLLFLPLFRGISLLLELEKLNTLYTFRVNKNSVTDINKSNVIYR